MEQAEESQVMSPFQPPPPPLQPSTHLTEEEMEEEEEPQAPPPPPPPPSPHATEAGIEEVQGKGGMHRGKEDLVAQRLPPSSLPLEPEIPLPVDDRGFHRDHAGDSFDCAVGVLILLSERYGPNAGQGWW